MRKNFLVVYSATNAAGTVIKSGKMRCKNKLSEFDAQAGLESHFQKTLVGFSKLIVSSCKEETYFDSLFSMFNTKR